MIDLHTHTDASDGTLSARELIQSAARLGLEALAITDHDTFDGYDRAVPCAAELGLDLVCGVELSTKYGGRTVHLLGYFLEGEPGAEFRKWIEDLQQGRRMRNRKLADLLQSNGFDITLEEVQRRGGNLPGRPHFAALLVEKGYAASMQQAFDRFLDESAPCYVPREEPDFGESAGRILAAGGLPSLAHPGRVSKSMPILEEYVDGMRTLGLRALEVFHSDHSNEDTCFYESLASRLSLAVTGGSDFHGEMKPRVALGTGIDGKLNVPRRVLDDLRSASRSLKPEDRA